MFSSNKVHKAYRIIFEEFDFDVTGTDTFACTHAPMIPALTSSQVADMAVSHALEIADADALFISCTNLATMDRIAEMEERHGKPVITSNSATLWRALRAAELPPKDLGVGALFRRELVVWSEPAEKQEMSVKFVDPPEFSHLPLITEI